MKPGTPGFVGARLREAREARDLTAVALADLIGVTRPAVSQYETGRQSPAPDVMRRISERLNVPIQFFLRSTRPREAGAIFYRCMSSATKKARVRAERRYGWLREIVHFLRGYVQFPNVAFPALDIPDHPIDIDDAAIEEAAQATRRAWGLGDGPISNITWLLENHGSVVTRCELGAATLDAFSEWCPEDSVPYIILNAGKSCAARSRYDAAHELGHMMLHRSLNPSAVSLTNSFALVERQAHRFAGAFLLPASSFAAEAYTPSLDVFRAMKAKWRVSIQAMIRRSADLGLLREEQERRLWVNLGRRKWRTREPLDDILEPEEPRFLRRSFELLISNGVIAPHEVPFRLGFAASDIEELTGLDADYLVGAERQIHLLGGTAGEEPITQIIPFRRP